MFLHLIEIFLLNQRNFFSSQNNILSKSECFFNVYFYTKKILPKSEKCLFNIMNSKFIEMKFLKQRIVSLI